MGFDGLSVVETDLDSDHSSFFYNLAEAGVEDERFSVSNTGLDDDVRCGRLDDSWMRSMSLGS
jgi:hypothetical protein